MSSVHDGGFFSLLCVCDGTFTLKVGAQPCDVTTKALLVPSMLIYVCVYI